MIWLELYYITFIVSAGDTYSQQAVHSRTPCQTRFKAFLDLSRFLTYIAVEYVY